MNALPNCAWCRHAAHPDGQCPFVFEREGLPNRRCTCGAYKHPDDGYDREAWQKRVGPGEQPTEETERAVLEVLRDQPEADHTIQSLRSEISSRKGPWLAHAHWLAEFLAAQPSVKVEGYGHYMRARVTDAPALAALFESDELTHE